MENREFKVLLKEAKLNKKQLSEIVELAHGTVVNWGTSQNIPHWVKSWLENYIKAKKYDELMQMLNEKNKD